MKLLKYTHPAKSKFDLNKAYSLAELEKEMDVEKIKILFTPIDFEWKKKRPTKEVEEIKLDILDGEKGTD